MFLSFKLQEKPGSCVSIFFGENLSKHVFVFLKRLQLEASCARFVSLMSLLLHVFPEDKTIIIRLCDLSQPAVFNSSIYGQMFSCEQHKLMTALGEKFLSCRCRIER